MAKPAQYPKRMTLDLSEAQHAALRRARLEDEVTASDRIRALLDLWEKDSALASRVQARARELAVERNEVAADSAKTS